MAAEARLSASLGAAIKKYQWKRFIAFRIESSHTFPGCPDWLFLFGPTKYLFLELKAEGGSLTRAQRIVLPAMLKLGLPVKVLTKTRHGSILTDVGKKDGQSFRTAEELIEYLVEEYSNDERAEADS